MRIKYCLGLHVELAASKRREKQKKRFCISIKLKQGVSFLTRRTKEGGKIGFKEPSFFMLKHPG